MPPTRIAVVHTEFGPVPVDEFAPEGKASGFNFLVLHGAGKADRKRMYPVCERLAAAGHAASTFDALGHGENEIPLDRTCLRDRWRQAQSILQTLPGPRSILSFSMGGQTAIDLFENGFEDLRHLILFAPAAYAPEAADAPFGPAFSDIIRQPGSWKRSNSFRIISRFPGSLMIVKGAQDAVIPQGLPERLYDSAVSARKKQYVRLAGHDHSLSGRMLADPVAADGIMAEVTAWID
jgi:uncharacterized protein